MDKKTEDKFIELLCKYTKKDITPPLAHRGDEIVAMLEFINDLITTAAEETKGFVENLEYHSQGMGCGLEDRDIR